MNRKYRLGDTYRMDSIWKLSEFLNGGGNNRHGIRAISDLLLDYDSKHIDYPTLYARLRTMGANLPFWAETGLAGWIEECLTVPQVEEYDDDGNPSKLRDIVDDINRSLYWSGVHKLSSLRTKTEHLASFLSFMKRYKLLIVRGPKGDIRELALFASYRATHIGVIHYPIRGPEGALQHWLFFNPDAQYNNYKRVQTWLTVYNQSGPPSSSSVVSYSLGGIIESGNNGSPNGDGKLVMLPENRALYTKAGQLFPRMVGPHEGGKFVFGLRVSPGMSREVHGVCARCGRTTVFPHKGRTRCADCTGTRIKERDNIIPHWVMDKKGYIIPYQRGESLTPVFANGVVVYVPLEQVVSKGEFVDNPYSSRAPLLQDVAMPKGD